MTTTLNVVEKRLAAPLDFNVDVDQLTFREGKGSFVSNSQLRGQMDLVWRDSFLSIAPFDLYINGEQFQFNGQFYLKGQDPSKLSIANKATCLEQVRPLLPINLQKALTPYYVEQPFYAKANITTTFGSGDKPLIEVFFDLDQHNVTVYDVLLGRTTTNGRFVNRLETRDDEQQSPKKRFKFDLRNLRTTQGHFRLYSHHARITSTLETGPRISMGVKIKGKTNGISDWLNNDQFLFDDGRFELTADVNGSLLNINSIIAETDAVAKLHDFSVIYDPANVRFPFDSMQLKKEVGDAFFTIVNSSFASGKDLMVDGWLKNLPSLLFDFAKEQVNSQAAVSTSKLTWSDFLNWFGENGLLHREKKKTEREKKQSMKMTLKGLYTNFQPKLSIKIDTLAYFDLLQLDQFSSAIRFEKDHVIILEETSFAYDEGTVTFSGLLDISHPTYTPFSFKLKTHQLNLAKALPSLNYLNINILSNLEALPDDLDLSIEHYGILDDEQGLMPNTSDGKVVFATNQGKDLIGEIIYEPDTSLTVDVAQTVTFGKTSLALSGNPKVFNDFFNTEQFVFNDGQFNVALDYIGNLGSLKEILTNGDAKFSLKNSEVLYKPGGVIFPLRALDLKLKGDRAQFDFDLTSKSLEENIHLNGEIDHLSELVIEDTDLILKTEVNIQSKKIDWSQLFSLFSPEKTDTTAQTGSFK
ncbi:MAG: hypothetical protein AAGJ18_25460, partial [Bacteroidota bacterium]